MIRVSELSVEADGRSVVENWSAVLSGPAPYALSGLPGVPASALLEVLAGRQKPRGGHVQREGRPLARDEVGYVSREHRLVGTLTPVENLAVGLLAQRIRPAVVRSRAEAQLEALGLPSAGWHNLVEQLSGGQQQRVALARALVSVPDVLVLDEPTSELDPDSAELVSTELERYVTDGGCCVLSTDDPVLLAHCELLDPLGLGVSDRQAAPRHARSG